MPFLSTEILIRFFLFIDPESLIRYGGLLMMFLLIYASTGLFFCFFLPGGAVIFTAGVLVASGGLQHDMLTVCSLLTVASLAGSLTGYGFGRQTGKILYNRKDSKFFKRKHLIAAENFYTKYGGVAIIAGFFLPVIRNFAPVVAGIIRQNFRHFIVFSLIGSTAWVSSFAGAGYLFASLPFIKPWLTYIVTGFIILVTVPLVIKIIKEMNKK